MNAVSEDASQFELLFVEVELPYFKAEVEEREDETQDPHEVGIDYERTSEAVVTDKQVLVSHHNDEVEEERDRDERGRETSYELEFQDSDDLTRSIDWLIPFAANNESREDLENDSTIESEHVPRYK